MIIAIIIATLKCSLHIVITAATIIATIWMAKTCGLPVSETDILNAQGIIQEILGKLPRIGELIEKVFTFMGASVPVSQSYGITVYREIGYAVILVTSYWLMNAIQKGIDGLFSGFSTEGLVLIFEKLYSKLCVVVGAVLLSNILMHYVDGLFSLTGERIGGIRLFAILVVSVYLYIRILDRKDRYAAAINAVFSLITSLIVLCLIYTLMLFFSLLDKMQYATPAEGIALSIGAIICLSVLIPMGLDWFAKNISGKS